MPLSSSRIKDSGVAVTTLIDKVVREVFFSVSGPRPKRRLSNASFPCQTQVLAAHAFDARAADAVRVDRTDRSVGSLDACRAGLARRAGLAAPARLPALAGFLSARGDSGRAPASASASACHGGHARGGSQPLAFGAANRAASACACVDVHVVEWSQ